MGGFRRGLTAGWALVLPVLVSGCVTWSGPLPLAPLAPLPHGSAGRVSASTEVVVSPTASSVTALLGAGSVSLHLAPGYDLMITSAGGMAAVLGDAIIADGPVRIGLLHGAGLGFEVPMTSGTRSTFFGRLDLGLLVASPRRRGLAAALGWSSIMGNGAAVTLGGSPVPTTGWQTVYLSIDYDTLAEGLELGPQVSIVRYFGSSNPAAPIAGWMITADLTVSTPF